jgi:4-carboxymuconolactone decarboxylase
LLTITILATLGNAKPQLAYHINCGLNIGISREEIIDIMTHISGYAGFPSALNGVSTAKEVFAERDKEDLETKPA